MAKLPSNPKQLLLIDGIGALVSAFMLGVVLVRFQASFGIPIDILYFLAALPCLFALFDFVSYATAKDRAAKALSIIAVANLVYCALSLSLAFYHMAELTALGWAYIVGEVVLVVALALYELNVARKYQAQA